MAQIMKGSLYRHKVILHVRDNYSNMFESLSLGDPNHDLTDYSEYGFFMSELKSNLTALLDFHAALNFYDEYFYEKIYSLILSEKDLMERLEAEMVLDEL